MEFYRNKKKVLNLILMCTGIFLVLMTVFLYSTGVFTGTTSTKPAAISAVFGLILGIVIIRKLLSLRDSSPLLILSNEGITSKVTAVSKAAGLISWEDITDISINRVGGDTLITLTIDKPDHYIPMIRKKLSAMVVDGIKDENGNLPIHLTAAELDHNAQELFELITTFRSKLTTNIHVEI